MRHSCLTPARALRRRETKAQLKQQELGHSTDLLLSISQHACSSQISYTHMHKLITVKGIDRPGPARAFLSAQAGLLAWLSCSKVMPRCRHQHQLDSAGGVGRVGEVQMFGNMQRTWFAGLQRCASRHTAAV